MPVKANTNPFFCPLGYEKYSAPYKLTLTYVIVLVACCVLIAIVLLAVILWMKHKNAAQKKLAQQLFNNDQIIIDAQQPKGKQIGDACETVPDWN